MSGDAGGSAGQLRRNRTQRYKEPGPPYKYTEAGPACKDKEAVPSYEYKNCACAFKRPSSAAGVKNVTVTTYAPMSRRAVSKQ